MADSNIRNLNQATTIGSNDWLVLEQGGIAKKVAGSLMTEFVNRNIVDVSLTTIAANQQGYCDYDSETGELELYVPRGTTGGQIDSITKTSTSGLVDTYTVTVKDGAGTTVGTYTFTVTNGSGAVNSVNGKMGSVVLDGGDINVDDEASSPQTVQALLNSHTSSIATKQSLITSTTIVLDEDDWDEDDKTQTITGITGLTAASKVIVSPTLASYSNYNKAGVYCSAQGAGTLTFQCKKILGLTSGNYINVNVMIIN